MFRIFFRIRLIMAMFVSLFQIGFRQAAVVLLILTLASTATLAGDLLDSSIFFERFDTDQAAKGRSTSNGLETYGARIVSSGPWGWSLRLDAGTYAKLSPPQAIRAEGGTISLWIQPLWKETDERSHTFLSLAWNDPKHSYLALSQGWWEPEGAKRLYFIASNQDSVHCSVPRQLQPAQWTMVTAVWKSGADGYCALYVNGERVADLSQSFDGHYSNQGPLVFGSDAPTTHARMRSAVALVDEIAIYKDPLKDRDVQRLYQKQEKDPSAAFARKFEWLERGLEFPEQSAHLPSGERVESRIMFDEDMRWATSRESTDQILARLKAAGFNVYIPCVWHGNGTYFPTELADTDSKLAARMRAEDPLTYLIEKAHALGMEVHPWFTVVLRENDRFPQFFDAGTPEGAYNVHRPEFRRFIANLMIDVVRRYDVDGVNLDYIRAMGICTSPWCREDYERKSGAAFWPDYALRGVIGTARARLERWQDDDVRDILERFAVRAKQLKPHLMISVDGHPTPRGTHRALDGRHEVKWLADGLIDIIFSMDYAETIDYENLDAVRRELRQPERLIEIFGNYDKLNQDEPAVPRRGNLIAKYAAYAQRKWPGAVAFYLYWQMNDEQAEALRNGPFHEPAVPSWRHRHRQSSLAISPPLSLNQ